MRVTMVISSLGSGGAERVMSMMANHWARRGWAITLLTLDDGAEPPFYELDSAVRHRPLGVAGRSRHLLEAAAGNVRRLSTLRRAIRESRPEVVLSFMDRTNVITLLATAGLKLPVVVAERSDPAQQKIGRAWEALRRWTYPASAALVAQSPAAAAYFDHVPAEKKRVVPNPVLPPAVEREAASYGQKTLVAMGRLSREKGFDMLLRAFAQVAPSHPDWRLVLYGEGPLRAELEAQRERLGLSERVALPGRTKAPTEALALADLFVLSSRYEGFPNALCEAMAVGLPVVSFDCPSGPREIVRPGKDGLLVPAGDIEALAAALAGLMADPAERDRLGHRAREVVKRFGVEEVMGQWEDVLQGARGRRARALDAEMGYDAREAR